MMSHDKWSVANTKKKKKKTEHIPGAISCKSKSVEGYHLLQHAVQLYKNKKLIKLIHTAGF